jgi:predicted nucleic acid-binding protein
MDVAFADSSGLVRLYADEPGADDVRSLSILVVSQLARVEVPAALWRKNRMGELSATDNAVLLGAFAADYFGTDEEPGRFFVIAVTASLLDHAARLTGTHGLRAYDAIQLASACAVSAATTDGITFTAFDKTLRTAAAAEGLGLLPD